MASMRFHLLGLFGLLGLLSVSSAANVLDLRTTHKILTSCGENVTIKCEVTTDGAIDITEFVWRDNKDICNWGTASTRPDIECKNETSSDFTSYNFSMIINNIQPKHKASYHCKLKTKNQPAKNGLSIVRVQGCVGNSTAGVTNGTNGTCVFQNVFPKPTVVNWTQAAEYINSLASTDMALDPDGFTYTVVSSIKLTQNQGVYNCSLVVPIENELNVTVPEIIRSLTFAGADSVIAHWLGVMLAMVLGMVIVQA